MTTIKASCPSCGDVELTPQQVRLVLCSVKSWSYYAFICTTCADEIRKPAGRDVVALLISGGGGGALVGPRRPWRPTRARCSTMTTS